jgi:hypothetical protein
MSTILDFKNKVPDWIKRAIITTQCMKMSWTQRFRLNHIAGQYRQQNLLEIQKGLSQKYFSGGFDTASLKFIALIREK